MDGEVGAGAVAAPFGAVAIEVVEAEVGETGAGAADCPATGPPGGRLTPVV
jgi:hypothetical protein